MKVYDIVFTVHVILWLSLIALVELLYILYVALFCDLQLCAPSIAALVHVVKICPFKHQSLCPNVLQQAIVPL